MTATSISEEIRRSWDDDAASYEHLAAALPAASPGAGGVDPPPAAPPAAGPSRHGAGRRGRHRVLTPLLARQGYQVTTVDLSAVMLQILTSKTAPRELDIDTTNADVASPPRPDLRRRRRTPSAVDLPDPGIALAAWRAAAPGGRLALIKGSSGGTGQPLSPPISMKHPGNRCRAVGPANMQLCATGPKANFLSIGGA